MQERARKLADEAATAVERCRADVSGGCRVTGRGCGGGTRRLLMQLLAVRVLKYPHIRTLRSPHQLLNAVTSRRVRKAAQKELDAALALQKKYTGHLSKMDAAKAS